MFLKLWDMSYRRLGDMVKFISNKNTDGNATVLFGINIDKFFMPSVANIIGVDLKKYKVVKKHQFACNRMHVGRDERLPISMSTFDYDFIVSPAYDVFEVITSDVLPEYLMLWFRRKEFDRQCWFYTDADVRGGLHLDALKSIEIKVPSIEKQRQIVAQYQSVANKIKVNEQICEKLEATAQALYKHWFVAGKHTERVPLGQYIETNPSLSLRKGQIANYTEMSDLSDNKLSIKPPKKREYSGGARFQNNDTLFARITPCLENGKTGFVNYLEDDEIAFGSTEFIVIRPKSFVSQYWIYCLCKDDDFRAFAISSMIGSSGRQRVHESYLLEYKLPVLNRDKMMDFHNSVALIFEEIKILNSQTQKLTQLQSLLLSRLAVGEN